MKRNILPTVKTWYRLDEHVRRLTTTTTDLQTDVEVLKTTSAQGGQSEAAYKVYSALLSQSGIDAPTVNILENTLGDIVWTRLDIGVYIGTLTGAYTTDKTSFTVGTQSNTLDFKYNVFVDSTSEISFSHISNDHMSYSDSLNNIPIEIRVYN